MGTWVWFGVQIIAASGLGVVEEREVRWEVRLEKCSVEREEAVWGPWGAGSMSARRWREGLELMERACRGPIRPPPMRMMLSF